MEGAVDVYKRAGQAVELLLSSLSEVKQLASLAVELAAEYSHLYSLLHLSVEKVLMNKIGRMVKEGILYIPGEGEKPIRLMFISMQEDKFSSDCIKRVFERVKREESAFYYFLIPGSGEDLEPCEKVAKIISLALSEGGDTNVIIVLMRSFKALTVEDMVFVNDFTTIDRHNVTDRLANSGVKVVYDSETFGGGPIAHCIHVFAKSKERISFLDLSVPEKMTDGVVERLVALVKDLEAGDRR